MLLLPLCDCPFASQEQTNTANAAVVSSEIRSGVFTHLMDQNAIAYNRCVIFMRRPARAAKRLCHHVMRKVVKCCATAQAALTPAVTCQDEHRGLHNFEGFINRTFFLRYQFHCVSLMDSLFVARSE